MTRTLEDEFETLVQFFRTFGLSDAHMDFDEGRIAARDSMISRNPEAWREAQRRGPLSEQEEFETQDPERHTLH